MFKLFFIYIIILSLFGFSKCNVKEDKILPHPYNSNHPLLPFYNNSELGLYTLSLSEGEDLTNKKIKIMTFDSGKYTIYSNTCNIPFYEKSYTDNIELGVDELLGFPTAISFLGNTNEFNGCDFRIVVQPDYLDSVIFGKLMINVVPTYFQKAKFNYLGTDYDGNLSIRLRGVNNNSKKLAYGRNYFEVTPIGQMGHIELRRGVNTNFSEIIYSEDYTNNTNRKVYFYGSFLTTSDSGYYIYTDFPVEGWLKPTVGVISINVSNYDTRTLVCPNIEFKKEFGKSKMKITTTDDYVVSTKILEFGSPNKIYTCDNNCLITYSKNNNYEIYQVTAGGRLVKQLVNQNQVGNCYQ